MYEIPFLYQMPWFTQVVHKADFITIVGYNDGGGAIRDHNSCASYQREKQIPYFFQLAFVA